MTPLELKKLRLKMGLSQENFAHVIGVTAGTYNRWEKGVTKPQPLAIARIKSLIKEEVA